MFGNDITGCTVTLSYGEYPTASYYYEGQPIEPAVAVAAADGTTARSVDIRKVQNLLVEQDVPLPRHPGVDPSYTECCEAHEYGLFTDMAKEAKTNPEYFKNFRQW